MRLAIALVAILAASPAIAEEGSGAGLVGTGAYGTAGCGLGAMAFGGERGPVQIIAATLNTIFFWNQTLGMTTGTLNCGPGLLAQGTKNFVDANREVLAKDISRGEGEAIGALTVINSCKDSRAVGAALQRSFATIFPSENATNEDVTRAIMQTLHADRSLGCAG